MMRKTLTPGCADFDTPTLPFRQRASAAFTLVEIMVVVMIIGILLAIAVPNFVRAREASRKKSCAQNLRRVEWAKSSYLMDKNLPATTVPQAHDLYGTDKYVKQEPTCPGDASQYEIRSGMEDPICSYKGGNVHTMTGE